jgi:hypothetical protein
VVQAAAARPAGRRPTPYRMPADADGGLFFGYSNLTERAIPEGIGIFAAVIDEVRSA